MTPETFHAELLAELDDRIAREAEDMAEGPQHSAGFSQACGAHQALVDFKGWLVDEYLPAHHERTPAQPIYAEPHQPTPKERG